MAAKHISHIGIAVKDLDAAMALYRTLFGVEQFHREVVAEQRVAIASFPLGETTIELTAATDDESPIAKFIAKRGEGIHHIAVAVDDVNAELARVKNDGIELVNERASLGAHDMLIGFLHPKSTGGVMIEFCQKKE